MSDFLAAVLRMENCNIIDDGSESQSVPTNGSSVELEFVRSRWIMRLTLTKGTADQDHSKQNLIVG